MSKASDLADAILGYVLRGFSRTSGEIHKHYKVNGEQAITAALRLLIESKRATRSRVSGHKGFLYAVAAPTNPAEAPTVEEKNAQIRENANKVREVFIKAGIFDQKQNTGDNYSAEFDPEKRKWKFSEIKDPPNGPHTPFMVKCAETTSKDGTAAVNFSVDVPNPTDGFDTWWSTHGPFSTPLWVAAPKSPELLAYIETHRRSACAVWVSAAGHFCPLSKVGGMWQAKN